MTLTPTELAIWFFVLGLVGIGGYLAYQWSQRGQPSVPAPVPPPTPAPTPTPEPTVNKHADLEPLAVINPNEQLGACKSKSVFNLIPDTLEQQQRTIMTPGGEALFTWFIDFIGYVAREAGRLITVPNFKPNIWCADPAGVKIGVEGVDGTIMLRQSIPETFGGVNYAIKLTSHFEFENDEGVEGNANRVAAVWIGTRRVEFAPQQSDEAVWSFRLPEGYYGSIDIEMGLNIQYATLTHHFVIERYQMMRWFEGAVDYPL